MAFDPREFRNALGAFATGVTVITCMSQEGKPVGLTANSFNSVSLDPPLVLFSLDRKSFSFAHFQAASHFAVNILADSQQEISRHFARPSEDKWRDVSFDVCGVGCPAFKDALAVFECSTHTIHDGGDHIIIVGRVEGFTQKSGDPLVYYRGKYARLASAA